VAGRNTYEDSEHFGGGSPHPSAPLFLLSHRPAPRQIPVFKRTAELFGALAGDRCYVKDCGRPSRC
jgi:hypothetical protein